MSVTAVASNRRVPQHLTNLRMLDLIGRPGTVMQASHALQVFVAHFALEAGAGAAVRQAATALACVPAR